MVRAQWVLFAIVPGLAAAAEAMAPQQTGAFTGTVVAGDGRAIAGLEVHCDWAPDVVQPGAAQRVSTRTDAAGRFTVGLTPGRLYCVWACGPGAGDAQVWTIEPRFAAAAGGSATIAARAAARPGPVRVRGLAAWARHAPLRLRIHGSRSSVVADVPLAADGTYELPPLPCAALVFDLLGSDGAALARLQAHLEGVRELDFGDVVDVQLEVVDAAGQRVAGAVVHERLAVAHGLAAPLAASLPGLEDLRVVATTGADGRATGRILRPGRELPTRLFARHEQRASACSGWLGGRALGGARGEASHAGLAATLVLAPAAGSAVTVQDWPAGGELWALVHGLESAATGPFHGSFFASTAAQRVRGDGATVSALPASGATCRLAGWLPPSDGVPCVVGVEQPWAAEGNVLRAGDARTLLVRVVDEQGAPVPFASIGVGCDGAGAAAPAWHALVVASPRGEARIVTTASAAHVYALGERRHGLAKIDAGDTAVQLQTRAFVERVVRVVDAGGAAIAGASLHLLAGPDASLAVRLALAGAPDPWAGQVSDARGRCTAWLPTELLDAAELAVVFDGRVHHVGPLGPDEVVVPLGAAGGR